MLSLFSLRRFAIPSVKSFLDICVLVRWMQMGWSRNVSFRTRSCFVCLFSGCAVASWRWCSNQDWHRRRDHNPHWLELWHQRLPLLSLSPPVSALLMPLRRVPCLHLLHLWGWEPLQVHLLFNASVFLIIFPPWCCWTSFHNAESNKTGGCYIVLFYPNSIFLLFLLFDTIIWSAPTNENEGSDHHNCANPFTFSQVFVIDSYHSKVQNRHVCVKRSL